MFGHLELIQVQFGHWVAGNRVPGSMVRHVLKLLQYQLSREWEPVVLRGGFRWKDGGAQVKGQSWAGLHKQPCINELARGGFLYNRTEAVRTAALIMIIILASCLQRH